MSSVPALVLEIADELMGQLHFEVGGKGGFKFNGKPISRDAKFLFTCIEHGPLKAKLEGRGDYGEIARSSFSVALANEIYMRTRAKQDADDTAVKTLDSIVDLSDTYLNDSIKTPLSKLKIIYNVKCRRKSAIYDTAADIIYTYDHDLTLDILKARLGVDGRADYLGAHTEYCIFSYVPGKPRIAFDKDGAAEHKIFNLWSEADWRIGWTPAPQDTLPALVEKFFKVFIEDEGDRNSTLAWLRDMTFGKADPILILCGEPGIGKNLFVQKLATALVGKVNYREAARGFKDSSFHNNVSQCRLFFMDEMELTVNARDTLKSYHNGSAAIERKGVDVSDPEPIHASFVLANNFEKYIRLEYTDRKFFAPKLTKRPLEEKMTMNQIKTLVSKIENDRAYLQQIGNYLFHKYAQGDSKDFKKTEFFEALCVQSYPVWFQRFIMSCKAYDKFTNKMFNRTTRHASEPHDIKANIEHYKSTFKKPLATMEIRGDGTWVVTSEIFDPTIINAKPVPVPAVVPAAAPAAKYKNGKDDTPPPPPPLNMVVPQL